MSAFCLLKSYLLSKSLLHVEYKKKNWGWNAIADDSRFNKNSAGEL